MPRGGQHSYESGLNLIDNLFDAFDDWLYTRRKFYNAWRDFRHGKVYKTCMQEEVGYRIPHRSDPDQSAMEPVVLGDSEDFEHLDQLAEKQAKNKDNQAKRMAGAEMIKLQELADKNTIWKYELERNAVHPGEEIPLSGFLIKPGKTKTQLAAEEEAKKKGEPPPVWKDVKQDDEVDENADKDEEDGGKDTEVSCAEFKVLPDAKIRESRAELDKAYARFRDLLDKTIPHLEKLIEDRAVTEGFL
mmetsp:Transcript_18644/g.46547  ORF Transcript_18644/g.46547 Transcript_18644/m.46547 type:complete len:245 (-) Transcript_18644:200-934(-)|eukprot:CAMPEP_0178999370 /NCGR_PEP_ID=MMETSP0795-20121207/10023_1 /TAXON_ID=88552 /ORGANISM="Amoebophrya sp., Strain Ameob2" /LENGTH=244 /DNA_ID=CAMNT_0020692137 /DNA_START=68 /DNA_END=802 /DNA_ORIENTATION=-